MIRVIVMIQVLVTVCITQCQLECVKTSILNTNTLDVYPNPSNNIFNIELNTISQESIKIKVMNTIGDIIYSNELVNYKGEYSSKIVHNKLKEYICWILWK